MLNLYAIRMLKKVRRMILAEPKRMTMLHWFHTRDDGEQGIRYPACGMVGCIGGWIEELHRRAHPRSSLSATNLLNLPDDLATELFFDHRLVYAREHQTKRYAEAVAAHIDRFIEKYR